MPRVDVWDLPKAKEALPINCGHPRTLLEKYDFGKDLGKGGFGKVRVVISKESGKEYACKSICKRLDITNLSVQRQAAHLENIEREIQVLRRLRGALNVAHLRGAYEDDDHIHIVMEYCRGGELLHHISSTPHYTEKTVASFMRGVLRTITQCHSHNILHRDIKPGNFMLLDTSERSPLKAIDFGLAVFFDPEKLPRTDLGLEGTPWFMAPEALSSKVYPASDVWAAGVMAYQLLSGRLPFDDRRNPNAPSLSLVWKSVLTDEPPFKGNSWADISDQAKDFVLLLLNKDPDKRPTAREALKHPWLAGGTTADRGAGAPLRHTVVQRIQRFAQGVAQGNALRRSIFELIATELLKDALESPHSSAHGPAPVTASSPHAPGGGEASGGAPREGMLRPISAGNLLKLLKMEERAGAEGGAATPSRKRPFMPRLLSEDGDGEAARQLGPGGGSIEGPPLLDRSSTSAHGGLEYYRARGESVHGGKTALDAMDMKRASSIHGGGSYWRIMRAAAEASRWPSRSGLLGRTYLHCVPRTASEKQEQSKVSRLALDTSVHGSKAFQRLVRQITRASSAHQLGRQDKEGGMDSAEDQEPEPMDTGSNSITPEISDAEAFTPARVEESLRRSPPQLPPPDEKGLEVRVRGRGAYSAFLATGLLEDGSQPPSPSTHTQGEPHKAVHFGEVTIAEEMAGPPAGGGGEQPQGVTDHPQGPPPASQGSDTMPSDGPHVSFGDPPGGGVRAGGRPRRRSTKPAVAGGVPPVRSVTFAEPAGDDDDGRASLADAVSETSSESAFSDDDPDAIASAGDSSVEDVVMKECVSDAQPRVGGAIPNEGNGSHMGSAFLDEPHLPSLAPLKTAMPVDFAELRDVLRRLNFSKEAEATTGKALAEGLAKLGYKLEPGEMKILMQSLAGEGEDTVPKAAFVASQLDWQAIQQDYKELWLSACRRVFADLDKNKDNTLTPSEDLVAILSSKLPREEIEYAVEDALQNAGIADAESLDFEGFLRIVGQAGSMGELEQYEARHSDASHHGGSTHGAASRVHSLPSP